MASSLLLIFFTLCISAVIGGGQRYQQSWESIDSRPVPKWYNDAKFGIFVHWGVYSVPAWGTTGGAAGEWYEFHLNLAQDDMYREFHAHAFGPDFPYRNFSQQFSAEMFFPEDWVYFFIRARAQYVVLTSKHHDGYTLWPSAEAGEWSSTQSGPRRDIVGEVAEAVRDAGLHFGLYYSLLEWSNPRFLADKNNGFATQNYVDEVMIPQIHDIVDRYQPEILWADGDWDAPDTYWRSKEIISWLYNDSPVKESVVTNDRWGKGVTCQHGGVLTCSDRFFPGTIIPRKWESCLTMDTTSWGYNRNADISAFLSTQEIIHRLVSTVSFGGNLLLNVGPEKDGRIPFLLQERLLQIGAWLDINGEAIFATQPWREQQDSNGHVYYTQNPSTSAVYCLFVHWPENSILRLAAPLPPRSSTNLPAARMLGYPHPIRVEGGEGGRGLVLTIPLPDLQSLPSTLGWAIKLENIE